MFLSPRRWRQLIVLAGITTCLCYLFLYDASALSVASPGKLIPFAHTPKHDGKTHWSPLPDNYPVTSYKSIPTGQPSKPIPNVQRRPAPAEDEGARKIRETRLAAVKESFGHSWTGYKKKAWLSDEVGPLSGRKKDPFGGWAATLVDALDTLWIMGLETEFRQAVTAAEYIDFTISATVDINVFETTIRYLGGFLAAYEVSGQQFPVLLIKAIEVGELLMCAFDTPNRMPISRWNWREYLKGNPQKAPYTVLVAEVGSLSLEFTKLSQLTGDMKYYDAIQRIADHFERSQDTTKLPGMWPVVVKAPTMDFADDNSFTLGGMSDSLYEYFPKQYLILGGALEQPRKLYEGFIEVAKKHLFRRVLNPDNIPLVISGDVRVTGPKNGPREIDLTARGQHLTCFVGGMVGLAAKIFSREKDLSLAAELTDACVWTYNSTASGIGPEVYSYVPCGAIEESQTGSNCAYSKEKWHAAARKHWRPYDTTEEHEKKDAAELKKAQQLIESTIQTKRLSPGFVDMQDPRYILRPEAIESVFIMYRITGDVTWMDKAWTMFQNVEKHTRSSVAAASLTDVTQAAPAQLDSMESFWLAETLKYYYLAFSAFDVVDLDEWVLNTEAHPLRRPAPTTSTAQA